MTTELLRLATSQRRRPARWAATPEEFWALPESTLPAEYVQGEIIMAPAPTVPHQTALRNVFLRLHAFAADSGSWTCWFSPLDVILPTGDVVQPDIFCLTSAEAARAQNGKRIEGAPSFIVEIISPGSTKQDLIIKRDLYLQNGVPEYWVVDPVRQTINQFVLLEGRYALTELAAGDTVSAVVLDGFNMSVADLLGIA